MQKEHQYITMTYIPVVWAYCGHNHPSMFLICPTLKGWCLVEPYYGYPLGELIVTGCKEIVEREYVFSIFLLKMMSLSFLTLAEKKIRHI